MFRSSAAMTAVLALAIGAAACVLPPDQSVVLYDDGPVFMGEVGYGGEVGASYLGVDIRDISADRVAPLKLKEERGVEVTMVDRDAPAGKAGMKEHDVILEMNGQPVESVEQLRRLIKETPPGRSISLGISRDGQPMTIKATLADRRKAYEKVWRTRPEALRNAMPGMAVPALPAIPAVPAMPAFDVPTFDVNVRTYSSTGIVIESLSPQLGEYFGVRSGEGVLVRSVDKGSPADQAGLKAGDVIVRVDKDRITDRGDWRSAMRKRSGKVNIGIIRDRKEQSLPLTLPERHDDNSFRIEVPEVDWEAMHREMQRMRPEVEKAVSEAGALGSEEMARAMREARAQVEREMRELRREMERTRKELERSRKEAEKEKPAPETQK